MVEVELKIFGRKSEIEEKKEIVAKRELQF